MSKSRRKRSREKQRQREAERQQAVEQPVVETLGLEPRSGEAPPAEGMTAAEEAAREPPPPVTKPAATEPESPFITGPVAARATEKLRAEVAHEDRELIAEPLDDEEVDDQEDDEDDDLEGEGGDLDDEGDEDEDEDEGDLELEDCLFEAACGAVEQGPKLAWSELCAWLAAVEITDPRLALLIGLLCEDDTKLTGERVLSVLEEIELGYLTAEARELVAEEAQEGGAEPEERAVVRTTSRELKAQAEQHLGGRRDERKPVKSSQLRKSGASRSVIAAVAQTGAPTDGGRKS